MNPGILQQAKDLFCTLKWCRLNYCLAKNITSKKTMQRFGQFGEIIFCAKTGIFHRGKVNIYKQKSAKHYFKHFFSLVNSFFQKKTYIEHDFSSWQILPEK